MSTDPLSQHLAGMFFGLFLTFLYFWVRDWPDWLMAVFTGASATACVLSLVAP